MDKGRIRPLIPTRSATSSARPFADLSSSLAAECAAPQHLPPALRSLLTVLFENPDRGIRGQVPVGHLLWFGQHSTLPQTIGTIRPLAFPAWLEAERVRSV